jgi:hypothetical protein
MSGLISLWVFPGPNPSVSKHTLVELNLRTSSQSFGWKATISSDSGKEVRAHGARVLARWLLDPFLA